MSLENERNAFEVATNRSISMPLAGAIVWLCAGLISLKLEFNTAVYVLLFLTGAIFPLALIIAKIRNESLIAATNPLSKLMGLCVLMVNLLWGIHLPLVFHAPEFVPLSLGIGLGLHWIVYAWIINHPLGIIHSILRTILIVLAWYVFPEIRIFAISIAIVLVYSLSLFQMLTRKIEIM